MDKVYKKLEIDYKIPDDLEDAIEQYVHFLNTGEGLADDDDYYIIEIILILNWCYREKLLPDNKILELREYYQYGGIKK